MIKTCLYDTCKSTPKKNKNKYGALAGLEKTYLPILKKKSTAYTLQKPNFTYILVQRFNPTPSSSDNNAQAISGKSCLQSCNHITWT